MADFDPVAKERLRERVRAEAEAEYARAMEMRRKKIAELDRLREQQGQAAGDRIAEALALLESPDWTDTRGLLYGGDLYRLSGSFRGQARSQTGKDPVEVARLMDASARAIPVEVPAPVVEPDPPAAPYVPDFTMIPDQLAKYAEADESAEDFRKRAFSILFRFGIAEGENFEGGGEPLSPEEKIRLLPMLIANFAAGNWLNLTEDLKP